MLQRNFENVNEFCLKLEYSKNVNYIFGDLVRFTKYFSQSVEQNPSVFTPLVLRHYPGTRK